MLSPPPERSTPPRREYRTVGAPFPYRGRVKTGCSTCRQRKIKCGEEKPTCTKCKKSGRSCIWTSRGSPNLGCSRHDSDTPKGQNAVIDDDVATRVAGNREKQELWSLMNDSGSIPSPEPSTTSRHQSVQRPLFDVVDPMAPATIGDTTPDETAAFLNSPSGQALMTSQDIYLCTTIDLMAAREAPQDLTFSYFVGQVNVPLISPFDPINWHALKVHIKDLATEDKTVAVAITAVEALYKAQANTLPTTHAMSLYASAYMLFETAINDDQRAVNNLFVTAFLLCLMEVVMPSEVGSVFLAQENALCKHLETWSSQDDQVPEHVRPYMLRIVAYLWILHAAARRGGGPGLLPTAADVRLRVDPGSVPNLPNTDSRMDPATYLYNDLSTPLFRFYLELQLFSIEVANLSHYHRSRFRSVDQEEAEPLLGNIKTQLLGLWKRRPSIMQSSSKDLRQNLSQAVAEPLIVIIGLCIAHYRTEIVEIGRTLSDPPLASPEARQHIRQIRGIVEGDYNVFDRDGKLNAGYLRPLFLCAIESINPEHSQWAIGRLKQINDHICRSDFFVSFAEALVEAQRNKERRVTTRWLCIKTFGLPPPYL